MKRFLKFMGVTASSLALMCTNVFADNSAQVLNLLKDGKYIAKAAEFEKNYDDEVPKFFVKDMNNDGNLEIYIMTGNTRAHCYSHNYLISFINGKPQCTSYSGGMFYGFNPETGIFVNSYSGGGIEDIQVYRLNKNGTVSCIHNIKTSFDNGPETEEDEKHISDEPNEYGRSLVYYIQVDGGKKQYCANKAEFEKNKREMLGYYELQGVGPYDMIPSNYGPAVNSAKKK